MDEAPNLWTFYETPVFTEDLEDFLGDRALDMLYAIQADLIADPERWPVVKGTGGARKGRIADPASSKGKSGSYRYLYLYLELRGQIYLLFLFAKSEQENLDADQTKLIANLIKAIKEAV
jgi:hypothetical protein